MLRRLSLVPTTILLFVAAFGWAADAVGARVTDVRLWSGPEGTRLVLDLSAPVRHEVFSLENPDRIVIDLDDSALALRRGLPAGQGPVKAIRTGPRPDSGLRMVLDLSGPQNLRSFTVPPDGDGGHRLVVELPPAAAPTGAQVLAAASTAIAPPVKSAMETAAPVKTVAAAKGRDLVIAIDAGHGGKDPGAIGRGGTREKDVTLAIARRLAARINAEEGMRAVLIRDGDYFIPLGGRVRKAREAGADMFISVHADAVANRSIQGSSVYTLSLRGATDEASRWLAARENAADLVGGVSLDVENEVLASVLLDVAQEESMSDSIEAANSVLKSLQNHVEVHAHRVKQAGFIVLKAPDIPSMLVETAFISNPVEEKRLKDGGHQQRLADAIHSGVKRYFADNPVPGTKLASL